jgi:hypothetical protein
VCILERRLPPACRFPFTPTSFHMKKTLLALALFAFAGSTAFAHDGHDKDGKKGKKETSCTKGMAAKPPL